MINRVAPTDTDVVVIGGGGAGLIAAVTAASLGARVLLLEKGDRIGGTTILSVGTIMAAGSIYQKAAGISDTAEAHAAELSALATARGFEQDPELTRMFAENSAGTIAFLNKLGVNFLGPLPQPPYAVDRMHQVMPGSRAYIDRLEKAARKLNVQILVQSRVTRLLMEGDRVAGIEGTGPANESISVRAHHAVIVASGDMSANASLLRQYIPAWPEGISPINPLSTGDGQLMAAAIGAEIVSRPDMGPQHILNLRFVTPPRPTLFSKLPLSSAATGAMAWAVKHMPAFLIRPFASSFLTSSIVPDPQVYEAGAILVDTQGGRIVAGMTAGMQVAKLAKKQCYVLLDERLATKFNRWPHFFATAPGVAYAYFKDFKRSRPDLLYSAPTLTELGARLGFVGGQLEKTVVDVNRERESDKQLTKGPYHLLGPLQLWALPSPIGLRVDTKLRVLDQNGTPIRGLFAAGGAGVGKFNIILGHGHGLGWAFTSGRLAGQNAVRLAHSAEAGSVAWRSDDRVVRSEATAAVGISSKSRTN